MDMRVMPYKMGSRSAKALADALGCKRVRHDSTTFSNRYNHVIINWGWGGDVSFDGLHVYNQPAWVARASNKLTAFGAFKYHGVPTPEWTADPEVANGWDGDIVARYKLRGHSGDGIHIIRDGDNLIDFNKGRARHAPLYVKYIKKQDEYRYHVFNGQVIDIQQKRKKRDVNNEEVNYQVRCHHTGWVYCRDGLVPRTGLADMAVAAVQSLGLDFGGVDIIWNERAQRGYVLEVNTACGLEGETVRSYANAIREVTGG